MRKGNPMSHTTTARSPAAIWERVLASSKENLSPEEAQYFLRLSFPPRDVRRMNALAAKARAGTLTEAEDEELENYIHVGHFLGVLQSRARQALKRTSRAS